MPVHLHNQAPKPLIVSYGGGVNSTALLIECTRRRILADLILFADTGGELPQTMRFIGLFDRWLQERGQPEIIALRKTYQGGFEGLEKECLRKNMLPGLAYGHKSCSQKYKVEPQDRFLRRWLKEKGITPPVVKAIGFDAGEAHRAWKTSPDPANWMNWYPLVEWNWDREDCLRLCQEEGLMPAKSSCFFCPAMKKWEILQLGRTHPELLQRALSLEEQANLTDPTRGLGGRGMRWEHVVKADQDQLKLIPDDRVGIPCECYDG